MRNFIVVVLISVCSITVAQDSIGVSSKWFRHKFEGADNDVRVIYEHMPMKYASKFIKEVAENKDKYLGIWKKIVSSEELGVSLNCEMKCYIMAKVYTTCHGMDVVTFLVEGSVVDPKYVFLHSGMSTQEHCSHISKQN